MNNGTRISETELLEEKILYDQNSKIKYRKSLTSLDFTLIRSLLLPFYNVSVLIWIIIVANGTNHGHIFDLEKSMKLIKKHRKNTNLSSFNARSMALMRKRTLQHSLSSFDFSHGNLNRFVNCEIIEIQVQTNFWYNFRQIS